MSEKGLKKVEIENSAKNRRVDFEAEILMQPSVLVYDRLISRIIAEAARG